MKPTLTILTCLFFSLCSLAQDSPQERISLSEKEVQKITSSLEGKAQNSLSRLDKANEKYLAKFLKQEKKIYKKLLTKDSVLANEVFGDIDKHYKELCKKSDRLTSHPSQYSGHLDSLVTSLKFLNTYKSTLNKEKLPPALAKLTNVQSKLNETGEIRKYLLQRQQYLKEQLGQIGFLKELKGFEKEIHYYQAQVKEYKSLFEESSKLEAKLLEFVSSSSDFSNFFSSQSLLAGSFRLPSFGVTSTGSFVGLQTRAGFQQLLVGIVPNNDNQFLQTQITAINKMANGAKETVNFPIRSKKAGAEENDIKTNSQKTKSFGQRLEKGANIHFGRANGLVPTSADIALSLGYKLNDFFILGIESSYRLGLGNVFSSFSLSYQGVGLRSFMDYRLKGSLYLSGGYERLYLPAVERLANGRAANAWQESGLLGATKKFKLSNKVQGSFRLLFDFLSYQALPRRQPIIFRIGYNF